MAKLISMSWLCLFVCVVTAGVSLAQDGKTPDTSDCYETKLESAQVRCLVRGAQAANDAGICETAAEPSVRFNCLALYAERTRDTAPCERVDSGAGQNRALRDSCIAGVAVARHEPALCERARDLRIRDGCYMMLVFAQPTDPALCAKIENVTLREACVEEAENSE